MRTAVVEHAHCAVGMADHDHGLAADLDRPVVADIRHLALVPDIRPDLVEDALHLELEYRWIGVNAAVDAIGFHRPAQIQTAVKSHRGLLLSRAAVADRRSRQSFGTSPKAP